MLTRTNYETKLLNQLKQIPDELLPEFFKELDKLKNSISSTKKNKIVNIKSRKEEILSYAGSLNEIENIDEFINEIYKRRTRYFNGRKLK